MKGKEKKWSCRHTHKIETVDPTLKVPPEVGVIILSATVEDVESQVHNDRIIFTQYTQNFEISPCAASARAKGMPTAD